MQARQRTSWTGWIGVGTAGALLVGWFSLVGGLGSDHAPTALAATTSSTISTSYGPTAITLGITLPVCAGPNLDGSLKVGANVSATYTLALLALSNTLTSLTGKFTDTGLRASATFNHAQVAPFHFATIGGASTYAVAVVPANGKLTQAKLAVSQAVPLCNTKTETATSTDTTTKTVGSTVTSTTTVPAIGAGAVTVVNHTSTVTAPGETATVTDTTTSTATFLSTILSTITATTTSVSTFTTTVFSTVTTTLAG